MNTGSVYITIDVDWACDEVLEYTIDFLEKNQLKATFFITHDTPLLERLRKSPLFELGIHPNFQYLLNGTSEFHDMEEALDYILAIVPEAVSVRSHCLVQSSPILELFRRKGLRYEVNLFIPWSNSISLKPIWHYNGLLRIPYFWEDDFQCLQKLKTGWEAFSLLQYSGLKIFNFHPIHLYINTEDIKRYEKAKAYLRNPEKLIGFKYIGMGAFSFLSTLNEAIKNMGKKTKCIKEIVGDYDESCDYR